MRSIFLLYCLLLALPSFSSVKMGYYAVDLDTGVVISKRNESESIPLASLAKIPSLSYSLSALGANFQFKTRLLYKDGILVIKGGGDPSFTAQQLMSLVFSIPNKKIHTWYVDHSGFPLVNKLASLGLEDQTDQPSLSSLNIEFNRFEVMRNSDEMIPLSQNYKLGDAKVGKSGPKYLFESGQWKPNLTEKRPYKVALPSRMPESFFAEYFRSYAHRVGISLPSPIYLNGHNSWSGFRTLYTHESVDLFKIASLAMEYSNNLMAEMPMVVAGESGSYEKRVQRMNHWLNHQMTTDHHSFELVNASGIGLKNRASAKDFTALLRSLSNQRFSGHSIWSLFSIGGHSGWIRRRFLGPNARHRVFAKTGSIYFVKNIAGYLLTPKGKKIAFTILIWDPERRSTLSENLLTQTGTTLRKEAKDWGRASEAKADKLINQWLKL